jgi:mono/diheme cytochrome c family protein
MMSPRRAALIGTVALILAACGSSGGVRRTTSGAGPGAAVSGHEVFARSCSLCHSLSGHSSPKQQGGDLLGARLRRPVLVQFTAEMPVKHRLTQPQLKAVVEYVLAVQRGRR